MSDLYLANPDGSSSRLFVDGIDSAGGWSPSGSYLTVTTVTADDVSTIRIVDRDGHEAGRIVGPSASAMWAPTDDRLAVTTVDATSTRLGDLPAGRQPHPPPVGAKPGHEHRQPGVGADRRPDRDRGRMAPIWQRDRLVGPVDGPSRRRTGEADHDGPWHSGDVRRLGTRRQRHRLLEWLRAIVVM